jgi:hypothetical protein
MELCLHGLAWCDMLGVLWCLKKGCKSSTSSSKAMDGNPMLDPGGEMQHSPVSLRPPSLSPHCLSRLGARGHCYAECKLVECPCLEMKSAGQRVCRLIWKLLEAAVLQGLVATVAGAEGGVGLGEVRWAKPQFQ